MHRRADHLPPLPHRKEIGARHCCGRPRDKCRLLTQNPGRCHLPPAHNSQLIGQHLAYRNTPFSVRHGVEMACGAESGSLVYGTWPFHVRKHLRRIFRTAKPTFPERNHPRGAFGTGKQVLPYQIFYWHKRTVEATTGCWCQKQDASFYRGKREQGVNFILTHVESPSYLPV